MLRIMQERTRCETKYTVFEHFFMHLSDIDFLHPCTSNYLKNLLPWVYLIPFPQITTFIKFIQNCDEHSYFKVYLHRFLIWGNRANAYIYKER